MIIFEGKVEVPKELEAVVTVDKVLGAIMDKTIQTIDKALRGEKRKVKVELKIIANDKGKEINLVKEE